MKKISLIIVVLFFIPNLIFAEGVFQPPSDIKHLAGKNINFKGVSGDSFSFFITGVRENICNMERVVYFYVGHVIYERSGIVEIYFRNSVSGISWTIVYQGTGHINKRSAIQVTSIE